ncbi:class I SAM-dependent methyltransferase [Saccharopolyspora flava]|uniref:Methyltransferase domain-containing protein n=1 Tax=Saccharopolyspora flava TaxID=95161 RepID=A0A1I6TPQ8_9PSEU|nr:class I SAM-dependent methyltransferase [Saccharopolyspora flava]SFS90967.1 Methyltransferase domain-containing protein [Saccharopolyspora flava]
MGGEYLFEQDENEDARLRAQGDKLDELTAALFDEIGLRPGARVLDLGSGAGNVSLLAAERVGPQGSVLGIDRDESTVERARAELARRGVTNVEYQVADVQTLDGVDGEFDAVVGRLIYLYVPDPAASLRQAYARLRPGGVVAVQEMDLTDRWAHPMTPLWQQVRGWTLRTLELVGVDAQAGYNLFAAFRAGGLPDPRLGAQWVVRGAGELPDYTWADIVGGMLPLMERLGVTTREEFGPDTLAERMKADLIAHDGIMLLGPCLHAWTRKPG